MKGNEMVLQHHPISAIVQIRRLESQMFAHPFLNALHKNMQKSSISFL